MACFIPFAFWRESAMEALQIGGKRQATVNQSGGTGECKSAAGNFEIAMPHAESLAIACIRDANSLESGDHHGKDRIGVIDATWEQKGVVLIPCVVKNGPASGDALDDWDAVRFAPRDCTFCGGVLVATALYTFTVGIEEQLWLFGKRSFAKEPFLRGGIFKRVGAGQECNSH